MKIKMNGKTIKKIDRRTNKFWCKGYTAPKATRKRLRTQPKGNQRGIKVLFACSLIPMIALFLTGCVETRDAMNDKVEQVEAVEELPPSPKLEELSVVVTPEEKAEGDLFDKYFGDEANIARAIAQAESGMREDAISKPNWNGTRDRGIMQINDCHADKVGGNLDALLDKETNIRVAKQIRDSWESWNAWTVFRTNKYLDYLN